MNIFLYTILFFIGVIVGKFWKSAIYRIPRNISFTRKGILYIEPNKKSNKISQLFYPILGGILIIILGGIFKINIYNIHFEKIIIYIFATMYISVLIIIAGIDQKFIKINKSVLTIGVIFSILYVIYLYMVVPESININMIYLGIFIILLAVDIFIAKRYAENSYTTGILMLFDIMIIFMGLEIFTYTLILTTIEIFLCLTISKLKQKSNGNKKVKLGKIPVGYLLGVSNILIFAIFSIVERMLLI